MTQARAPLRCALGSASERMRAFGATSLWRLRLAGALAAMLVRYWTVIFPQARRELRAWAANAERIADPRRREHAMRKLRSEGVVAEGAAAFATLTGWRACRHVVRACVAFEVMYDYVDALGEQPGEDVLALNRGLHAALDAALRPHAPLDERPERVAPHGDDDYLLALVTACREAVRELPAYAAAQAPLHRLAVRAAEAQSLHHAATDADGVAAFERWAVGQSQLGALHWWELAAAAGSPLGIFALLALAGRRGFGPDAALAVERAYFPWIAALSWLLESLVDQDDDAADGVCNYVAFYGQPQSAARRLLTIAERALADARGLPRAARHTVLLAGMAALYLSDAGAAEHLAADAVRKQIGGVVALLLRVLRLRRWVADVRRDAASRRRPSARRGARRRWRRRRPPRRAGRHR